MADFKDRQGFPLAPANGRARSDEEANAAHEKELKKKKRMKYLMYGIAFVVFQTIVIVIFALTIMKVKTPKFRVRSGTFQNPGNTTALNINLNGQFRVKNTNFGPYKYDSSTVTFFYRGTTVGSFDVPKSKAKFLSTKKIDFRVQLSSGTISNSEWSNDISSGRVPLTTTSRLNGKVTLMFIMKKKKSTNMNCTMDLVLASEMLQNIKC